MIRPVFLTIVLALGGNMAFAEGNRNSQGPYGETSSAEENIGFLSGLSIGAMVGGPPGAIAGSAIGLFLGDGWEAKKRVNELQVHLVNARLELAMLQEETAAMNGQLARTESTGSAAVQTRSFGAARTIPARKETAGMENCCDNTVMSLYFRSGSTAVEEHDLELISSFTNLSRNFSNPLVEITGYADRNGDADANLQLSRQRTQQVKELLENLGIKNSSITTIAHGESRPLKTNKSLESDFFDRRVILRLRDANRVMLSRSTGATE